MKWGTGRKKRKMQIKMNYAIFYLQYFKVDSSLRKLVMMASRE